MLNARYRIEGVLGTGGSGSVCKAFDVAENRTVAMKRLAMSKLATEKDILRAQALFEREYYVLAELAHPKIIRVYDYGVDDDGPYYTMEWLRGASLRSSSPLPVARACALVRDIASSLAILHSRRLVHRDVTPHNIFCAEEGGAKLIDFGAMTPIGVPKLVVGTPPFMAPECVDFQPVDGRTDLYSLGACLYYALTGSHAYAARSVRELPELWRKPPAWPSRLAPDVPEGLDRLILEMLSLQPAGRPDSAAEVFERLTTLVGLDADEAPTVARAYLASPALAGRRDRLARILRRTLRAARGKGSSVVITGEAGVGCSRLLDAAVLEAKVAGFTVLRAEAAQGRAVPFAALRSMARVLAEAEPEASRALTAHATEPPGPRAASRRRDARIHDMVEAIRDVADRRPVALAVDDVHLIDDESLAALALLASNAKGLRLFLLSTLDAGENRPHDAALALLLSSSTKVSLDPFSAEESRELLSSLFGEVPNLDIVAAVAHVNAVGNARALLDGAETLVEGGLATYAGGAWTLSGDPEAVGRALAQGVGTARRLEGITADARTLLAVLALDRDTSLSLVDYPELAFSGDRARSNQAISDLVRSGLVTLVDGECRFVREAHRREIALGLRDGERRTIHGRIADRCEAQGLDPIYAAFHHSHAGQSEAAGKALDRFRDYLEANPGDAIFRQPIVLDALEHILSSDGAFDDAFRIDHGAGMVMNAVYQGQPERAATRAAQALGRLSWLTALDDYHARPDLDVGARLGLAFGLATERCAAASNRGLDPVGALRRLCQVAITTAICARFMADPALLDVIPDLSPFAPLSPAVALAVRLVAAIGSLVRGKDMEGLRGVQSICVDLRGSSGEGLDALTRIALERSALGQLCTVEAEYATDSALAHIGDFSRMMPDFAESCRARYYLARGMPRESEASRKAFERLSVQSGVLQETRISELSTYLTLYALAGDVLALKRVLAAITEVAKTRPGWRFRVALAKSHLARSRGDFAAGLATLEAAMPELPGEHVDWTAFAALRVALVDLSGDGARAIELGRESLTWARAHGLFPAGIALSLALAFSARGDTAEAEAHFALGKSALEGRGAAGIHLGWCLEVGARIAAARGDRVAFIERVAECARLYRHGDNPILTARYDALMRADRSAVLRTDHVADQTATVVIGRRAADSSAADGSSGSLDESSSGSGVEGDPEPEAIALMVERTVAGNRFV
jgi:hypothetical protein